MQEIIESLSDLDIKQLKGQTYLPLDVTAAHPDNKVTDEAHSLIDPTSRKKVKAIFLDEGAFYTNTVKVYKVTIHPTTKAKIKTLLTKATRDANGDLEVTPNTDPDYYTSHTSSTIEGMTGHEAAYNIIFITDDYDMVEVEYQCVGGSFIGVARSLQRLAVNLPSDTVDFDNVFNVPMKLEAKPFITNINNTHGWGKMITAIDRLTDNMTLGHMPAYISAVNKVCEEVKECTKPNSLVDQRHNGVTESMLMDGYANERYLSKSDMLILLKEYSTSGLDILGKYTFKMTSVSFSSNKKTLNITIKPLVPTSGTIKAFIQVSTDTNYDGYTYAYAENIPNMSKSTDTTINVPTDLSLPTLLQPIVMTPKGAPLPSGRGAISPLHDTATKTFTVPSKALHVSLRFLPTNANETVELLINNTLPTA